MDTSFDQSDNLDMKSISASKFKEQCLSLIEQVDEEGIIITKRGRPVAKLVPLRTDDGDLIGSLKGKMVVDPADDLTSTDAWYSDEWGDPDAPA
jgi:prevent-host-death family protein